MVWALIPSLANVPSFAAHLLPCKHPVGTCACSAYRKVAALAAAQQPAAAVIAESAAAAALAPNGEQPAQQQQQQQQEAQQQHEEGTPSLRRALFQEALRSAGAAAAKGAVPAEPIQARNLHACKLCAAGGVVTSADVASCMCATLTGCCRGHRCCLASEPGTPAGSGAAQGLHAI